MITTLLEQLNDRAMRKFDCTRVCLSFPQALSKHLNWLGKQALRPHFNG
jgi:hypothetical protein